MNTSASKVFMRRPDKPGDDVFVLFIDIATRFTG
jgi:hypothetical protein